MNRVTTIANISFGRVYNTYASKQEEDLCPIEWYHTKARLVLLTRLMQFPILHFNYFYLFEQKITMRLSKASELISNVLASSPSRQNITIFVSCQRVLEQNVPIWRFFSPPRELFRSRSKPGCFFVEIGPKHITINCLIKRCFSDAS